MSGECKSEEKLGCVLTATIVFMTFYTLLSPEGMHQLAHWLAHKVFE